MSKLSKIQKSYLTSKDNLTKDFRSYCFILSKKGKWIDKIYWSEI